MAKCPSISRSEFQTLLKRLAIGSPGGWIPCSVAGAEQFMVATADELSALVARSPEDVELRFAVVIPREGSACG